MNLDRLHPLHRLGSRLAGFTLVVMCASSACVATPRHTREVRVQSGAVSLAGTLVSRHPGDRRPALLLLHGSGPDGRDNPYYAILAEAFVRRGFVVFTYDKRGNGGSSGDWRTSPFSALIDDAAAAAAFLRRHPWVDSTRVGIWGGSEGAGIAPAAALREPAIAFVIMQSASGVTFAEQNLHQTALQVQALTDDPDLRRAALRLQQLKHAVARTGKWSPEYESAALAARGKPYAGLAGPPDRNDWWWAWYRSKMDYEPGPALRELRRPVLAIWGGADHLIPVQRSEAAIRAARAAVKQPGDSLIVWTGADHALQIHGLRGVWHRGLRNTPVHVSTMVDWALQRVQ